MPEEIERLRREALAADELFSRALRLAYGSKANDLRYQMTQTDPLVCVAASKKLRADRRWLEAIGAISCEREG